MLNRDARFEIPGEIGNLHPVVCPNKLGWKKELETGEHTAKQELATGRMGHRQGLKQIEKRKICFFDCYVFFSYERISKI